MRVYKTIDGDLGQAAPALAVGMSKLRELAKHDYFVNQTFVVDGVTVRISHNPAAQAQYIRVTGGSVARYEFFTSDFATEEGGYYTPPHAQYSTVAGHATGVNFRGSGVSYDMLASHNGLNGADVIPIVDAQTTDGPKWTSRFAFNNQKMPFVKNYTREANSLYTVVGVTGKFAMANNPSPWGAAAPAFNYNYRIASDTGWDVRKPVYSKSVEYNRVQPLLQPPHWWRRAKLVYADTPSGGRVGFYVVTDAMSNFHFFRVSLGPDDLVQQLPYVENYVKTGSFITVPASTLLPEWVEKPAVETMHHTGVFDMRSQVAEASYSGFRFTFTPRTTAVNPYTANPQMPGGDTWQGGETWQRLPVCDYMWEFNSDGSEASAVVFENKGVAKAAMATASDNVYDTLSHLHPIKIFNWMWPDVWVPPLCETAAGAVQSGGLHTVQARVRGLVSVSISISVTGDGPRDFVPKVTPVRSVRGRYFLEAAYAMDHAKLAGKGVGKDALLTTEISLHAGSPSESVLTTPPQDQVSAGVHSILSVVNHTTGATIQRWRMSSIRYRLLVSPWVYDGYPSPIVCPTIGNLAGHPYGWSYRPGTLVEESKNLFMFVPKVSGDTDLQYWTAEEAATYYPESNLPAGWYRMPYMGNTLVASDLKSLSFILRTSDPLKSCLTHGGLHLYLFGDISTSTGEVGVEHLNVPAGLDTLPKYPIYPETTAGSGAVLSYTVPAQPGYWPEYDVYKASYNWYAAYNYMHEYCTTVRPLSFIDVHPDGHYSAYASQATGLDKYYGSDLIVDVIAAYNKGKYTLTSHRDAFNTAFAQSRGYNDNLKNGAFPFGRFGTAGTWI